MPNPIRYMYFIIKHQINIQLLSVLFHDITVVLYIVISISMKAGFFLWILPLTFLFRNLHWIWQEMNVTDNMQMLKENGYKAPKSVSTEDSIMANTQRTGYSSNRLQNVYRMSIECLQNVYRGMLSSPQIRLKHFQRMMFPPIHQLRCTLCLFYQNMIQWPESRPLYNIDSM